MLTDKERLVAGELQANPRGSIAQIAENLGMAPHLVRTVYNRLVRSGALNVFAIVEPQVFGRPMVIGFRLRIADGSGKALDTLVRQPDFHWMASINDGSTVLATANFADARELRVFTEGVIREIPGVREVSLEMFLEFEPIPYFAKPARRPPLRSLVVPAETPRPPKMDEMDLALLQQYQTDARMSYADAAEKVGLSLSAVRQRTKKLEDAGILRFHVLPNPFVLGLHAVFMVSIKTNGPSAPIKEALRQTTGATFLSEVTGDYAMTLEVFVEEPGELESRIQEIMAIPGVVDVRTDIYREIIRDTGTWSVSVASTLPRDKR